MAGKTVKWSSFRCEIFSETKTPPKSLNIDDGLVQYVCTRTNTPSLSKQCKLDHVDLILFICLFYTLTMMCKLRGRGRSLSLARNPAWNYLYHVIVTCFFCPEKSLKNESINEITKKKKKQQTFPDSLCEMWGINFRCLDLQQEVSYSELGCWVEENFDVIVSEILARIHDHVWKSELQPLSSSTQEDSVVGQEWHLKSFRFKCSFWFRSFCFNWSS